MSAASRYCACCGQTKWIFDVLEEMAPNVGLCYDCTLAVYALRDALQRRDSQQIQETGTVLRERAIHPTPAFIDWYKDVFLKENLQQ